MSMAGTTSQIQCSACEEVSLLKRTPKYDGFKKIGETLCCAACGHEYASEDEVPFKGPARPRVFDDDDAPKAVRVFGDEEKGRFCSHCRHYVVNPFTQRCSRHNRVVEATDVCGDFERKPDPTTDAVPGHRA
jgi:hypothetical protein